MHFVLCGGVVDFDFFACLNVPESPHAQAAEIKKAVEFATVVYVSDSLFSAEDMFPFADLQGPSGGREKSVFSVQVDQNLVAIDRNEGKQTLPSVGHRNIELG